MVCTTSAVAMTMQIFFFPAEVSNSLCRGAVIQLCKPVVYSIADEFCIVVEREFFQDSRAVGTDRIDT